MKRILTTLLLALPLYGIAYIPLRGEEQKDSKESPISETVFKGTIGNMKDYTPLSNVNLTLTSFDGDLKKTVKTDNLGKFYVADIPAGIYKVRFEKDGFESGIYQSLNIPEGSSKSFGFLMFEE